MMILFSDCVCRNAPPNPAVALTLDAERKENNVTFAQASTVMAKTRKDLFFAVLEKQGPLKRIEFEQQVLPRIRSSAFWRTLIKTWDTELTDEEFARLLKKRMEMIEFFNLPKSPPWFDPKN
jgi:hypothetical protein